MREKKERNEQILQMKKQGYGARKIGAAFKISPQAVSQIINRLLKASKNAHL